MKVLILNFNESPENYHLEMALSRACIKKNINFLTVHNFKHDYSPLSTLEKPEKNRILYSDIKKIPHAELTLSIDFPWKINRSSLNYIKIIKEIKKEKIMITNHLIPMPSHSPFYDVTLKTDFFKLFKNIYIFDFEDIKNCPQTHGIVKRKYHIDTEYYNPNTTSQKQTKEITIFTAGSKGRNFEKLLKALDKKIRLIVISNSEIPKQSNIEVFKLNRNLFNFKNLISRSDFTVIPVSDNEPNETAGMAICFISMAMCKPVLIRRTKWLEEYIKDGINGFFYSKISDMKEKIDFIINQLQQISSIGKKARNTITQKASLDNFAIYILNKHLK